MELEKNISLAIENLLQSAELKIVVYSRSVTICFNDAKYHFNFEELHIDEERKYCYQSIFSVTSKPISIDGDNFKQLRICAYRGEGRSNKDREVKITGLRGNIDEKYSKDLLRFTGIKV